MQIQVLTARALALTLLCACVAAAAPLGSPAVSGPPASAVVVSTTPTPAPEAKSDSPIITKDPNPQLRVPISLNAQDASLSEILKVMADRSSMNFVAGEGVQKAKITIILNKTPVSEAIDLIVRAAGLSYEIIGNSVLIGEQGKL
jgi:type II secretory pathway component HofQ